MFTVMRHARDGRVSNADCFGRTADETEKRRGQSGPTKVYGPFTSRGESVIELA
jgi:hypothetical protein